MAESKMDAKAKTIVSQIALHIARGSFSEQEIHTLFVLLRDSATPASPVRELADFIAHRERDRGVVHAYIVANGRAQATKRYKELVDRVVFSPIDIVNSLNACLRRESIDPLPGAVAADITFCVMSLLQGVGFTVKDTHYTVGQLTLGVKGGEAILFASTKARFTVGFSVLRVPNRYFRPRGVIVGPTSGIVAMPLPKLLQVRFVLGKPRTSFVPWPKA